MKLAEALAERSDCQVKIEEIKKRLIRSARVQEGEQPAEDTTELLAESERVFARLLELVSAINRTNSKTAFDNGAYDFGCDCRTGCGWQASRLPCRNRGGRKHAAGSLLEVGGAICCDGVCWQTAGRSGPARKAVSRTGYSAAGTELEDRIDLSSW